MSIQNAMPGYITLATTLTQQGVGMTPAEMHGLLSGIVCGGNRSDSWRTVVHELTNDGMAFSQALTRPLSDIWQNICETLADEDFIFHLYLPDDEDSSVYERVDALGGWVNHFLLGLGVTQPKLDKVKGETGEAISDLRTIAQLGYDSDEDQEELEHSLEEVIEYVRVAALLCYETFTRTVNAAEAINKPTFH